MTNTPCRHSVNTPENELLFFGGSHRRIIEIAPGGSTTERVRDLVGDKTTSIIGKNRLSRAFVVQYNIAIYRSRTICVIGVMHISVCANEIYIQTSVREYTDGRAYMCTRARVYSVILLSVKNTFAREFCLS